MHTLQQRKAALLLYLKYERKGATVIRELKKAVLENTVELLKKNRASAIKFSKG